MKTEFLNIVPVLPSSDLERDLLWYKEKLGFKILFKDEMYAGLRKGELVIHLQWHANTADDPLLGGSVIRIFVNNIETFFNELVSAGILSIDKMQNKTPWRTKEFGIFDLNNNAIFFVESLG